MTAQASHLEDRQVVPRWRSFQDTIATGDLSPLHVRQGKAVDDVERALERVRSRPSPFATAQLLSVLLARGKRDDALRVARSLPDEMPLTLLRTVTRLRKSESPQAANATEQRAFDATTFARELGSSSRRKLRDRPNHPTAWVDLALAHTIQGFLGNARREVRHAMQLAPDSRFVLRAAARLFVHLDDPEQANHILNSSARVLSDPWLMAAEISTAELAFGRSSNLRRARALIELSDFSPRALSELTSELATSEIRAGRDRKARALFERSFVDPTENAVAQAAAWAERSRLELDPRLLRIDRVYEARALESARAGSWENAILEAAGWHDDQPFAVEPLQFGSYVASVGAGDYERGAEIATTGLRLHQGDRTLANNAAYSLANLGRTAEARELLGFRRGGETVDDLTEIATLGLIAFRDGDVGSGQAHYRDSIKGFERMKRQDLAAMATVHLILEECRLGLGTPNAMASRIRKVSPLLPQAEREAITHRIQQLIRDLEAPAREVASLDTTPHYRDVTLRNDSGRDHGRPA